MRGEVGGTKRVGCTIEHRVCVSPVGINNKLRDLLEVCMESIAGQTPDFPRISSARSRPVDSKWAYYIYRIPAHRLCSVT